MADTRYGDSGDNNLRGTNGVYDLIAGFGGDDRIWGYGGDDLLYGGDGNDELWGGNGDDTQYGGAGNDDLWGDNGDDTLDGGIGNDRMEGGDGDDTYHVDSPGDVVSEVWANYNGFKLYCDGVDTVVASVDFTLPHAVEHLILVSGTVPLDGTGNAGNNVITGNDGINTLTGLAGEDTLVGRGGNDALVGGAGGDILHGGLGSDTLTGGPDGDLFVFDTAPEKGSPDAITDFSVVDDRIWLDDAVFAALPRGPLATRMFHVGSAARDPDDRIIYDPTTGALTYDANGSAPGGSMLLATLSPGLALTAADFSVV
jgi:Ca2+-binding RTX toxin-like protein